jgi:hypothetical protein
LSIYGVTEILRAWNYLDPKEALHAAGLSE